MQSLYFVLALVVTGILWTWCPAPGSATSEPSILVPWFLGLAYAFDSLGGPPWHQLYALAR